MLSNDKHNLLYYTAICIAGVAIGFFAINANADPGYRDGEGRQDNTMSTNNFDDTPRDGGTFKYDPNHQLRSERNEWGWYRDNGALQDSWSGDRSGYAGSAASRGKNNCAGDCQ